MMLSQIISSFLLVHPSLAFILPTPSTSFLPSSPTSCQQRIANTPPLIIVSSSSNPNDADESDDRKGMDKAFDALNELSSLDLSDPDLPPKITETTISAEAMEGLLQNAGLDSVANVEGEVAQMTNMMQELELGEEGIYNDVMGSMFDRGETKGGGSDASATTSRPSMSSNVVEDADGIGATQNLPSEDDEVLSAVELSTDSDEFMKKALEEAMAEVKKTAPVDPRSDPNSILNDEKLMAELNDVFDKANEQLKESIAEIREEQV